MPYGYLTDPQLARDFWAIYTVEPDATGDEDEAAADDGQEEDDDEEATPPPSADRGCGIRPGAVAGDRLDLPALPPARQAAGVLDRVGADLLPRPARRVGAAPVHRVRPRADRADRASHARRRRGPARAGLPREARADQVVPLRERVPVRAPPELGHVRRRAARGPGPEGVAQRVLRRGQAWTTCRRSSRSGRMRSRRSTSGTRKPNVPVERVPHPSSRDAGSAPPGVARRDPAAARRGDARPRRRTRTGRTTARRSRRPTTRRSRSATCRSACPTSSATTQPGRQGHPRHNNSVSRPTPDDGHTLIWIAPGRIERVPRQPGRPARRPRVRARRPRRDHGRP